MKFLEKKFMGLVSLAELTIILPISMCVLVSVLSVRLYFAELDVLIDFPFVKVLVITFTLIHLCCSPMKDVFCNGTWSQAVYNIFPCCLFGILLFAQRHFVVAVVLLALTLAINIWWFSGLVRENWNELSEKKRSANREVITRLQCATFVVVCLVPSFISFYLYEMKPPTYEPSDLVMEDVTAAGLSGATFDSVSDLWSGLRYDVWKTLDVQARTDLLQRLSSFETSRLGCPSVPLSVTNLGLNTYGSYSHDFNVIVIDTSVVMTKPVETVVNTVLEETFHAYENYVVLNINWNNSFSSSAFFDEARQWKENYDKYIDGFIDFDGYESQPLEASAKEFAQKETRIIMDYINSVQSL